jgi:release factor glutamine methyltransferase
VREAIKHCRTNTIDVLIDIGTGSGIIPISMLASIDIPQVFAVDISPQALEVATKNSLHHKKDIIFLESDLLDVFLEENAPLFTMNANILIVTNLPYIKQDDWENMSSDTMHEPELALFGGQDTGFELYQKLFGQLETFIQKYKPLSLLILAEMGEDQKEIADAVMSTYRWKYSFFHDLLGIERFMKIQIQ